MLHLQDVPHLIHTSHFHIHRISSFFLLSSWVKAQNYKHALQGERLTLSDIWCHPMGHKIGQMGSRLRGECVLDPFVLLHILPPSRWPLLTRKRPTRVWCKGKVRHFGHSLSTTRSQDSPNWDKNAAENVENALKLENLLTKRLSM